MPATKKHKSAKQETEPSRSTPYARQWTKEEDGAIRYGRAIGHTVPEITKTLNEIFGTDRTVKAVHRHLENMGKKKKEGGDAVIEEK